MNILSGSEAQTKKIGKAVAQRLMPGDIVCLFGSLGSGKTVLVKGIALGLGVDERDVVSPSFVLMRTFQGEKFPLYHFDLYRLEEARHIASIGYEEYFYGPAVAVIEWAERLDGLMPAEYLKIEAALGKKKTQRCYKLSGVGKRYKQLLEDIGEDLRR